MTFLKHLGAGLSLRSLHLSSYLDSSHHVPWVEILVDNLFSASEDFLKSLDKVREQIPFSFHCVGMNLGSCDEVRLSYLDRIKAFQNRFEPFAISDHLSFVGIDGIFHHDLLPIPYNDESLAITARNISKVQDHLNSRILIENPSVYMATEFDQIDGAEFLNHLAKQTGSGLLLDINNIYVSYSNLGKDPHQFLESIDVSLVGQGHLAGYTKKEGYLLDSHGEAVHEEVWSLYKTALEKIGNFPVVIEWDANIPSFDILNVEREKAQRLIDELT